jgi:hypothetical protein
MHISVHVTITSTSCGSVRTHHHNVKGVIDQ